MTIALLYHTKVLTQIFRIDCDLSLKNGIVIGDDGGIKSPMKTESSEEKKTLFSKNNKNFGASAFLPKDIFPKHASMPKIHKRKRYQNN